VNANTVVMVPGGMYEDMDATRFWVETGVTSALEDVGFDVMTVDRPRRPVSWIEEGSVLADQIRSRGKVPVVVVAGSNGCSAAVRLAVDHPGLVTRLVLCWPATARDARVDDRLRKLIEAEAGPRIAATMLEGATLRGVSDDELRGLFLPVSVIPSDPENVLHQGTTVDALDFLLPDVTVMDGSSESPSPEFPGARSKFVHSLIEALSWND
jgi:pimeloyl-ACP methyl ester carboxylesterase